MFDQGIVHQCMKPFFGENFLVFTWEVHLLLELESQDMEPNYRFNNPW